MHRNMVMVWWSLTCLVAMPAAWGVPVSAEDRKELSQYGITWRFAAPARVGRGAGEFVKNMWQMYRTTR
jgi:hypothetical protein